MIFNLLFGIILLVAGRNFFWLCVGVIGFLLGVQAGISLGFSNQMTQWIAALGLGLIGIVLAVFFEWAVVVFGVGFLGGGYLLMHIFFSMTPQALIPQDSYSWLIFVAGGIVGMCLMIIAFDFTLIVISSLLGATLIVQAFQGTEAFHEVLFIASFVAGIFSQYLTLKTLGHQPAH